MAVEVIHSVRLYIAGAEDALRSIDAKFEEMAKEANVQTSDVPCSVIMEEKYIDSNDVEHSILFCMVSFFEHDNAKNFDKKMAGVISTAGCREIHESEVF